MTIIDRPASSAALDSRVETPATLIVGLLLVAVAAALVTVAMSATAVSGQIIWGAIALGVFCTGLLLLMAGMAGHGGLGLAAWRIGPWSLAWGAYSE